ncbi:MAG: phospho-sugar mutase [Clostridia bacterium]|nr:phospho-sugar mutase [Clostridia bacterium]
MEKYIEKYNNWLNSNVFDEKTKTELKSIEGNKKEIEDRFYKDLEFGTGGLRGVIGAGTNRMNIYTVRKATQGLANYIIKQNAQDRGVAIAYDSRNMSIEFSEEVALCLNANGIKSYRFESLRPTPELSFAVRELNCIAGVVITASHNPPEYNGYKVYWEDGGQIVPPYDKEIINEVNAITDYANVCTMDKNEAIERKLYNIIGKEIDDRYIEELKKIILNPQDIEKVAESIRIVYTPLHGTGNLPVQRILKELGFKNVFVVPEQEKPNGNFPTVSYPNPEDPKAFELALELAKKVDADIVLATDPDADRLGVYAKDTKTGEYKSFTGNMSGLLIAEYELSEKRNKGLIKENGALVKTIVSSNMANEIVKEYKIKLIEVLTGFKYIGEQIKLFETNNSYEYLFGYEESYGCLIGTYARDKDAVSAVMALCEAAAFYKNRGLTLWDQMLNIYEKYGYYKEGLASITLKGIDGVEKIKSIMKKLRESKFKKISDWKLEAIRDYESKKRIDINGSETELTLPKSNVLYYELENNAWVCVRPSGTEPKIKFYMGVVGNNIDDSESKLEILKQEVIKLVE